MKAYVLHAINDLRYDDVPMPQCPKGWAIVKVRAAGICSSDIARVFTKGTYHFLPFRATSFRARCMPWATLPMPHS